jgi:hypothetical protein
MSIAFGAGAGAFIAFKTMQFAHEEHHPGITTFHFFGEIYIAFLLFILWTR